MSHFGAWALGSFGPLESILQITVWEAVPSWRLHKVKGEIWIRTNPDQSSAKVRAHPPTTVPLLATMDEPVLIPRRNPNGRQS